MRAILYVGHGSRVQQANEEAITFIKGIMAQVPVENQEYCFLELSPPTIPDGVMNCMKRGATEIIVVPILLLTAAHIKIDIPFELSKMKEQYPAVSFTMLEPIGVHDRAVDVLIERVKEKKNVNEGLVHVLLVGRGSSDKDQISDFKRIAEKLQQKSMIDSVDVAFLAAAEPSFDDAIRNTGVQRVYVLPYLLFTGVLMKGMEKTIKEIKKENQTFVLCNYLGLHPYLQEIFIERINDHLVKF